MGPISQPDDDLHNVTDTPSEVASGRSQDGPGNEELPPAAVAGVVIGSDRGLRTTSAHPASIHLNQARQLLNTATMILTGGNNPPGAPPSPPPPPGQLAAPLAEITGWTQLHTSPGNLPTHQRDPDLAARMQTASDRLRGARWQLETLTTPTSNPIHPHLATAPLLDAADTMQQAWAATQQVWGYHRPHQLTETAALLADITQAMITITAQQQDDEAWWHATTALAHAVDAIHHYRGGTPTP